MIVGKLSKIKYKDMRNTEQKQLGEYEEDGVANKNKVQKKDLQKA
jgi:hypothetical protein